MAHNLFLRLGFAFALLSPSLSLAVELNPEQEAEAQEIFGLVLSPFCAARSLKDCPSGSAHELQDQIRERIAAGASRDQIFTDLIVTYGEKIRAVPQRSGFGLIGWLAPLIFAGTGLLILLAWLLRQKPQNVIAPPTTPTLDKETEDRIKKELERR